MRNQLKSPNQLEEVADLISKIYQRKHFLPDVIKLQSRGSLFPASAIAPLYPDLEQNWPSFIDEGGGANSLYVIRVFVNRMYEYVRPIFKNVFSVLFACL